MKQYLILKDFDGTQDGIAPAQTFKAGEVKRVSDSLIAALGGVAGGYLKDAEAAAEEISNAPAELASDVIAAITEAATDGEAANSDAEERETKVVEPEETKPRKPFSRK